MSTMTADENTPTSDGKPWPAIEQEIGGRGPDVVRHDYLDQLHQATGRNVIAYYSGFLHAPPEPQMQHRAAIDDLDKNSFMATIHGLDRDLGLDLILHTPGGDLAAAESLIEYVRDMFPGNNGVPDIRVIVPQMAMSAGTLIALASRSIAMGKHSSLGPIDPQFGGVSAYNVLDEFDQARNEIKQLPNLAGLWGPILSHYGPTLVKMCEHAVKWADEIARGLLETGMLAHMQNEDEQSQQIGVILEALGRPAESKSHSRHIGPARAEDIGLVIERLENEQDFQDIILPIHHAFMITIAKGRILKIVENHMGTAVVASA